MASMKTVVGASALALLVAGVVMLAFFSSPFETSYDVVDEVLVIEGGELKVREFRVYSKYDHVASFTVLDGTIITCDPLNSTFYHYWWENEYSPSWYETSEGEYNYPGDHSPPSLIVPMENYAFLFDNQDSYEKQVHAKVTEYVMKQNTTNLTIASALIMSGLVLGMGLTAITLKNKVPMHKAESNH